MQQEWLRQASTVRYSLIAMALGMGLADFALDIFPVDWRTFTAAAVAPGFVTAVLDWRRRQGRSREWHFWGLITIDTLVLAILTALLGPVGYIGVPFFFLAAVAYSLTIPSAARFQHVAACLTYPIARVIGLHVPGEPLSLAIVIVETLCLTVLGRLAIAGPIRFTYRVRGARRALGALAHGDFSVRLPARALDDLGFLAVSFNDTAQRLGHVVAALEKEVAERSRAEAALRNSQDALSHQAFHDALTGLTNRARFRDHLSWALGDAPVGNTFVLAIDLDGFKTVNDTLGHAAGDRLLHDVAKRLLNATRGGDVVARLGGDEFAILLPNVPDSSLAVLVADRVLKALRAPFSLGDRMTSVGASIGIARSRAWDPWADVTSEHPTTGVAGGDRTIRDPVDSLMHDADLALYHAKTLGKGRAEIFDPSLRDAAIERRALHGDLRLALDSGDFHLVYQPIVSLGNGRLVGVEALLRWNHPQRGMIPPSEFIPLAEETGVIVPLGRWVLRQACEDLVRWQAMSAGVGNAYEEPLMVSVNVSTRQLQDPAFVRDVQVILGQTGLDPRTVMLELTEGSVIHHPKAALERLRELKENGVLLAIDDFGTGYSALSYLRDFPIDVLKIDKAFTEGVASGGAQSALARTIVTLGSALSLRTLAEGIEDEAQHKALTSMGCDLGQGYHFSRPVAAAEIDRLLTGIPEVAAT